MPLLLELLKYELRNQQHPRVLYDIGIALGHQHNPIAIEPLANLKNNPDAEVRYGVTFGLLGYEDAVAINTLIELSADEDENIRNWATFGIGTMVEADTPEIREALLQNCSDKDAETRSEALVGLAKRKDQCVIVPLLKELTSDDIGRLDLEAAAEIASPQLYPALIKLKDWWDLDEELLNQAIESCLP